MGNSLLEFLGPRVAYIDELDEGRAVVLAGLHDGIPRQHKCVYPSGQHPGDGALGTSEN